MAVYSEDLIIEQGSKEHGNINITSVFLNALVGFATKTLQYFFICALLRNLAQDAVLKKNVAGNCFLSVQGMLKISAFCNLKYKHWAQSWLVNLSAPINAQKICMRSAFFRSFTIFTIFKNYKRDKICFIQNTILIIFCVYKLSLRIFIFWFYLFYIF